VRFREKNHKNVSASYYSKDVWLTGLHPLLFDKLWWALQTLGARRVNYTDRTGLASDASYKPDSVGYGGVLELNEGPNGALRGRVPDERDVFHELIHAYYDLQQPYPPGRTYKEYAEDEEFEERLAYAAQYMMENLDRMTRFDAEIKKSRPDDDALIRHWKTIWENFEDALATEVRLPSEGRFARLREEDFSTVYAQLGFKIRCKQFAKLYDGLAKEKGSCVRFFCTPFHRSTKVEPGTKPAFLSVSIPRVFVAEDAR